MSAWMLTEIGQLIVTMLILVGGGIMLATGHLDADTAAFVKTLVAGWSGFWLGAKVQANIKPSSTDKAP